MGNSVLYSSGLGSCPFLPVEILRPLLTKALLNRTPFDQESVLVDFCYRSGSWDTVYSLDSTYIYSVQRGQALIIVYRIVWIIFWKVVLEI